MKYQDRYAGVKATATSTIEQYALASMGSNGKARMGNTDRITTGAGYLEFLGWRHATPEIKAKILAPTVVRIIVDHWYGDVNASNIKGAQRLLRLFEVAPDDSMEAFEAAWKAYKAKVDPDAAATTPATAQDLAALLTANPALLAQALQALQAQTQQAENQKEAAVNAVNRIKGKTGAFRK